MIMTFTRLISCSFACMLLLTQINAQNIAPSHTIGAPTALRTADVVQTPGFVIENARDYDIMCWYPITGAYARLPRLLFYFILLFALFARTSQWLIGGALASALTYSGTAAIHATLLTWRGPAGGDLDILPIGAILTISCLISVPLLNWSSTLRDLGHRASKSSGASRIILLFWTVLVTIGFLAVFIRKFDDHNIDHLWTFSDVESITCLPEQGNISVSAGQIEGWTRFYITAEFIEENRCTDPCSTSTPPRGGTAVCRSSEDLQILTMKELDRQFEGLLTNKRQRRNDNIGWFYINVGLLLFPYIICQGVWAVCFWRKTPGQVRYVIFAAFKKIGLPRIVAKAWATLCYLAALFILVLSPPLFVLSLVTAETFLSPFPEGGGYDSLDAWGPWVGVALALVAALVAWGYETYHGRNDGSKIKAPLFSTRRWREGGEERDEMETRSIASSSRRARNALDRMKNEWKEFVAFWRDPDDAGVSRPHSTPRFHGRLERALIADEEERYGPNKPYGSVEMVGFTR